MRLLTAILPAIVLSLMLTACGQSGALYFPKPESATPESAESAERSDTKDTENTDSTTGP
jgi:predicted small lipoprotein YifL